MFQINALNGEIINIDSDFLTHQFENKGSKFLVIPFPTGIGKERMFFLFNYEGEKMFEGKANCYVLLEDSDKNKFTVIAHLDFYGYKNPISYADSPFQFLFSAPEIIEIKEGQQFSTLGKGLCCTLKASTRKTFEKEEKKNTEKTKKFYHSSTYCNCSQCGGRMHHKNFF